MKQILSKITSLFLAVLMVVLLCPVGPLADEIALNVTSDDIASTFGYNAIKNTGILLGSYNMLSYKPIDESSPFYGGMADTPGYNSIWNEDADGWEDVGYVLNRTNTKGDFYSILIRDVASYVSSQSKTNSVSVGVGVNAKISIFSASLSLDVKMSGTMTNETSSLTSHTYFLQEYVVKKGTYQLSGVDKIIKNPENYLDETFWQALQDINVSPAALFQNYGTHVILKSDVGGKYSSRAEVNLQKSSEKISQSKENETNMEAGGGIGNISVESNVARKDGYTSASGEELSFYNNTWDIRVRGGNTELAAFHEDDSSQDELIDALNTWNDSIEGEDGNRYAILETDNLELYPIWYFLADVDGAQVRMVQLENYFLEKVTEYYTGTEDVPGFYEKYVYKTESEDTPDYSEYTIISSPEEFQTIRDNPEGKYLLACNIDLSEYAEGWEPIEFGGILEGFDNLIYGIRSDKIFASSSTGTIKNVRAYYAYHDIGDGDVYANELLIGDGNGTISYPESEKKKVLIDFTESEETNFGGNSITIGTGVSEVYFVGDPTEVYTFGGIVLNEPDMVYGQAKINAFTT